MNSRVEWALWWCNMMIAMKNLTVVSVLAEPEAIALAKAGGVDGEARESIREGYQTHPVTDSRGGSQSL